MVSAAGALCGSALSPGPRGAGTACGGGLAELGARAEDCTGCGADPPECGPQDGA